MTTTQEKIAQAIEDAIRNDNCGACPMGVTTICGDGEQCRDFLLVATFIRGMEIDDAN